MSPVTDDDAPRLPGGYGGPPPTGPGTPQPHPQQYGSPYGQSYPPPYGSPYGQPYPQPYGQQPGYPGYPPVPPPGAAGPQRPGLVIASAVLAYVNAGLLLVGGALLIFGASLFRSIENSLGNGDTDRATLIIFLGVGNLVAGGLLIAGAIMFSGGGSVGRVLLSVANGLVLVLLIVWIFLASDYERSDDGWIGWGIVFGVLAVLSLSFSFNGAINRWLKATAGR